MSTGLWQRGRLNGHLSSAGFPKGRDNKHLRRLSALRESTKHDDSAPVADASAMNDLAGVGDKPISTGIATSRKLYPAAQDGAFSVLTHFLAITYPRALRMATMAPA